jgi:hypothetical protein
MGRSLYPDRIRQILVEMPRANPDEMGPKFLKCPKSNFRKILQDEYYLDTLKYIIMPVIPG